MMIPIPDRGVFRSVAGLELARATPFVEDVRITAKRDQLLEPLPEGDSYLGFIFARAPKPEASRLMLSYALTVIRTGHWWSRFCLPRRLMRAAGACGFCPAIF